MTGELWAAVGVTAAFWTGALYGARLSRMEAHAATERLRRAAEDAHRVAREAQDTTDAMIRLNMRLHRERRPWGVVDAHAWPDDALERLRRDIARWDAENPYDWSLDTDEEGR